MTELTVAHDGLTVTIQEGVHGGEPTLRLRTKDAITVEHAVSIFASLLTQRGLGDTELVAASWHRGAHEAWYKRPAGMTLLVPTGVGKDKWRKD